MSSRANVAGFSVTNVVGASANGSTLHGAGFRGAPKWAVLSVALVAALALPLGASARGWGGHDHRGGYSGSYYGGSHGGNYGHGFYNRGRGGSYYRSGGYYRGGGYNRGGYWSGGRWIAGAIVAGAVIGLINDVSRPAPVYYQPSVVYAQPGVVYSRSYPGQVVQRRVVETRTVYEDPYQTRYIRSDDDDGD